MNAQTLFSCTFMLRAALIGVLLCTGGEVLAHEHAQHGQHTAPREPIPQLTDEDLKAAFPPLGGHAVHDDSVHYLAMFDRLEAWDADRGAALAWEARMWIGRDTERVWLRSEGDYVDERTATGDAEFLYGRSIARWWEVVAGARHDFAPGDSRTWAAVGFAGLAPYKFDVEATAYFGESGRTAARAKAEYQLLLTNRLILQPQVEIDIYGRRDVARGIGSGVSTLEAGLRVRYEFTRRFAPYLGIVHERALGDTAELRRADGEDAHDTRVVAGLRLWF